MSSVIFLCSYYFVEFGKINQRKRKKNPRRQLLIRMFLSIRLNPPIERANKNTQNSERIISTEGSPCHTAKRRGMRFSHIMKRMILPEASLPLMTKNNTPAQLRKLQRRLYSPETVYSPGAVFCLQSISNVTAHKNGGNRY